MYIMKVDGLAHMQKKKPVGKPTHIATMGGLAHVFMEICGLAHVHYESGWASPHAKKTLWASPHTLQPWVG
jgi:hypothetical protein